MERFRALAEDSLIFLVMAIFSVMREGLKSDKAINWRKTFMRVFTNFVAGVGFYSFLISYKPWFSQYPQKIGTVMVVVYAGSHLIDIVVDKIYEGITLENLKKLINKF